MQYNQLEILLENLANLVENENPQKGYWRELWELVSRIRGEIRETRYPTVKEKNDAIKRLNELVKAAQDRREKQQQWYKEQQCKWEKLTTRSEKVRLEIENKVAKTRPLTNIERMIGSVILAPLSLLETALRSVLGLEQLDEIHENLKACNANMKEAWSLFNESKSELLPGDKNEMYNQLKEAQERLNEAWDQWRSSKNEAYKELHRDKEARQREREEKYQQFVARVEANIEKLEAKISNAQDALERQRNHLSDLQDKQENAWNDDFRERCNEWIEETEERINSIENSIEQWEEWLEQEREKLRR